LVEPLRVVDGSALQQIAHAMRELMRTREWQIYEGLMAAQLEEIRSQLEEADMDTFLTIQGEAKGVRRCLLLPTKLINQAKKRETKKHEDAHRFGSGSGSGDAGGG
jgi:hypothetical protein